MFHSIGPNTDRCLGHRYVMVKKAVIGSKGGWKRGGSSAQYLSCKVLRDWTTIK